MDEEQTPQEFPASFEHRGVTWTIRLDYAMARELRDSTEVNVFKPDDKNLHSLHVDPELLERVIWKVIAKQADSRGMTHDEFLCELNGVVMEAAHVALEGAILNFISPRQREIMSAALGRIREHMAKQIAAQAAVLAGKKTTQLIDSNVAQTAARTEAEMARKLTSS